MTDLTKLSAELRAKRAAATRENGEWKSRPSPVDPIPFRCVFFGAKRNEIYATSSLNPGDADFIAHAANHADEICTALDDAAKRITDLETALKSVRDQLSGFFDVTYGEGLEVIYWHKNGASEPFDTFIDDNFDDDTIEKLDAALTERK